MIGSLLENYLPLQEFSSSNTINIFSRIIEVDCTAGNVVLTLGTVNNNIPKNIEMIIKRIDDSFNLLTINGTAGNYEDEGIILFGLEATRIYASKSGIWRAVI